MVCKRAEDLIDLNIVLLRSSLDGETSSSINFHES